MDKRKGEIYFRCQQPREVACSSLDNLPPGLQGGHLEFYGEVQAGASKRAGSKQVITGGGWYLQPMTNIREGNERVGCALLGIPLLSGLFWPGGWYVLGHCKTPSPMTQSVIRNKNNEFQLEHELTRLFYF